MRAHEARPGDADAIAAIYNAGIAERTTTFETRPRDCYSGIAEFSVYTAPDSRGRGAAKLAMAALIAAAEERGFWKLVSRILVENAEPT